ncbi:mannitol dehydrogenase family protein [Streptomyces endophyticus]|uniref:Mannitol dehydrogenase family protein n=1 Tax=Streptomyces endophyticus TaxID=714166 RepID=A0ABU6FGP7_9ACTN|nr:mannitol dehydrogenase family protein [Streptomyces endophyticus]MEB8342450.1 mannitol dehydrogenase family protein [Streptomyces endophyticus]
MTGSDRRGLPRLGRAALAGSSAAGAGRDWGSAPYPAPQSPEGLEGAPGIVHLGLGNFHRAHQAVYTADALRHTEGPWGITGVSTTTGSRPRPVIEGMAAQDGLYTVLTLHRGGAVAASVPGVHHKGLVADGQGAEVVAALGAATTRIVSLTVTEKGYTFGADGRLDLDDPLIRADLAGGAPRTALGLIARGLQQRLRSGAPPVTLLSCDNLMGNGHRLRGLLDEFIAALPAAEREDLQAYADASVSTPNSMVDRIAPATTDEHRTLAARVFGVRDTVPVPAEPYKLWVMQDDFRAGRPAWEQAGAVFTEDVAPYELMKLRLLNGAHSLLAYLGLLRGHRSIDAAVGDELLGGAVEFAMREEILPTVPEPAGMPGKAYVGELLDRFANPALGHRTAQVGSDGSLKIPVRWAGTLTESLAAGRVPRVLALGFAAYVRVITADGAYDEQRLGTVHDDARARLVELASRATGPDGAARLLLAEGGLLPQQAAQHAEFADSVAEFTRILDAHGAEAALRAART